MHNERSIQRHGSDISVRIASIGVSAVTFSILYSMYQCLSERTGTRHVA